jgi:acyl carrier protein
MGNTDRIVRLIYDSVDEINEQLEEGKYIKKDVNSVLYGKNGLLDSLGLVNLIVAIEQNIEDNLEKVITIADERAMSQKQSPFSTIGALVKYINKLVDEENK